MPKTHSKRFVRIRESRLKDGLKGTDDPDNSDNKDTTVHIPGQDEAVSDEYHPVVALETKEEKEKKTAAERRGSSGSEVHDGIRRQDSEEIGTPELTRVRWQLLCFTLFNIGN